MPVIPAPDLITLRSQRPHTAQVDLYMAVAPYGAATFTAQINEGGWVGAQRGIMMCHYNFDIGEGTVLPGMTLWVGSAPGLNDRGTVRVRSINTVWNEMHVAENDDIEWYDDDWLSCPGAMGFFEIWSKLPRITENGGVTFYKDYDYAWAAGNTVIAPKANAGPPVCAWIDPITGVADVDFVGDRSFTTEIGLAITYQWDFADGAQIVGVATDAGTCLNPNVVRFTTPGFRYVSLTVQDNSPWNRTGVVYVPVWIFEEGVQDPYDLLEVSSLEGHVDEPWRLTVRVFQTETAAEQVFYNFPDGALVVLFSRTRYDGVEDAIGGFCHRENIRFVGWLDVETLSFDGAAGTVDFEAVASDGVMDWLPGFAYTVEDAYDPNDWYELPDLNVDRAMMELLELHTTVNWVCHVEVPGEGAARPVMIQQYPKASLYEMLQEHLLRDAKCLARCDRQGILWATRDPQFMDAADRAVVPIYCDMLQGDWMNDVDAEADEQDKVGWVRIGGFAYDQPYLSQAPGVCPSQSHGVIALEGHIFVSQAEANLWSGLYFTLGNLAYPDVPLALCGDWPVFDPADQQYIRLTTTDPLGRIVWTNQVFVVRGVKHEFVAGTCATTLAAEIASPILEGETLEIPEPDPVTPVVTPTPGPPVWGGNLTHVIIRTNQGIFFTETFHKTTPTWYSANAGYTTAQRQDVMQMAFDYKHGARLYTVVSSTSVGGLFSCQDLWDVAPHVMEYTSLQARTMIPGADVCAATDPNWNTYYGQWPVVYVDPVDGTVLLIGGAHGPGGLGGCNAHKIAWYSDDALATVIPGDGLWHDPFAACAPDHCATPFGGNITTASGWELLTFVCGWAAGSDTHRGWSTSKGSVVNTAAGQIVPWSANPAYHSRVRSEVIYWVNNGLTIWTSSDNGINWVPVGGGGTLPVLCGNGINMLARHHLNLQNIMYCDGNADLRLSTDGGVTWSAVIPTMTNIHAVVPAMMDGAPEGESFVTGRYRSGVGRWMDLTMDLGTTWLDKTGNLGIWLGAWDEIFQIICVQSEQVE